MFKLFHRSPAHPEAPIHSLRVSAYRIPTDRQESDGTLEWDHTTIVIVEASAAGCTGIGYTYADLATASLIEDQLRPHVLQSDAMAVPGIWQRMVHSIRNLGRPGISSMAISAVDAALWDLKARLLDVPLAALLGPVRRSVPAYGSGGFTSYSDSELAEQLGVWSAEGLRFVKMKIGREPRRDPERVRVARHAIGPRTELFVDANGAYTRKQALYLAGIFADSSDVRWFEEPVSSDDLRGLRLLRDRAPAAIRIAAGEYGYDLPYFRRMLEAGAVDVLQIDATRCGGITGFLHAAALAHAHCVPISAHTAPTLHGNLCCAVPGLEHIEYFHDHQRVEQLLFDGALRPRDGDLHPDFSRPGLGLSLKKTEAKKYAA